MRYVGELRTRTLRHGTSVRRLALPRRRGEKEVFWGQLGRYGFPSATVRAGDDIDVVQTPLGHLSPDFHDDYLHARE